MKKKHTVYCCNCGGLLTKENIRLAVEDSGFAYDELWFYCPSYESDREGSCIGSATGDESLPAYWSTK